MNSNSFKSKAISGILWKLAERTGAQAITFLLSIILARLLSPNDYGVIAILLVFITIADVFVNAGFGSALIQKKMQITWIFFRILFQHCIFCISLCCYLLDCTSNCKFLQYAGVEANYAGLSFAHTNCCYKFSAAGICFA